MIMVIHIEIRADVLGGSINTYKPMRGEYYSRLIKILIFFADFLLIQLAFTLAKRTGYGYTLSNDQFTSLFLIFSLLWIITGFFLKIYRSIYRVDHSSSIKQISISLLSSFIVHIIIITTLLNAFQIYQVSIEFLSLVYLLTATFIVALRVFYKLITKYFEFFGFDQRKVVIVGATRSGKALYHHFVNDRIAGYHFKGFFDYTVHNISNKYSSLIVGNPEDIKEYCLQEKIDEIYFALPTAEEKLLHDISRFADENFIYFRIAPDFGKAMPDNTNIFLINSSIPILTTRKEPLGISLNIYIKRFFDILFSLTVILVLFPFVFSVIALAIRCDSKGPIFFKQLRPGKKNKLFECYKFRTMYVNNSGERQAIKNDSRITRVGRFLRKTSLDELPQFFNVLLGNMSVVGPRPNMISQLEEYSKTIQHYKVRHFVTPGITGYAQVNGFRGETKELESMQKRVQYDVQYMENWSLSLDMQIICRTVWNMIKGERNAY
jgi:putative colanic acid biosysnthesis UDP-glucose lipid carrier transferase